ncbi:MAG: hypothetical protein ACJ8CG_09455 [Microvirga sp.]
MKLKLRNYKASLITLAAIGVLAISLTFTVWRLLAVGEDSRAGDSYSNLWEISQTQFEASVVAEALARTATGESFATPEETPGFRLAILIRRLSVLLEGEQKNLIARVGALESLQETYQRLTDAEPLLEKAIDAPTATRLRIQVHDLANQLRGIANQAMLLSHEEKAEKR